VPAPENLHKSGLVRGNKGGRLRNGLVVHGYSRLVILRS